MEITNTIASDVIVTVARVRMPALLLEPATRMRDVVGLGAAGASVCGYAHTPAFGKDVSLGVRAWSPPV